MTLTAAAWCGEPAHHPQLVVVYCTREKGHAGDHIAALGPYRDGDVILKQWAAQPAPQGVIR